MTAGFPGRIDLPRQRVIAVGDTAQLVVTVSYALGADEMTRCFLSDPVEQKYWESFQSGGNPSVRSATRPIYEHLDRTGEIVRWQARDLRDIIVTEYNRNRRRATRRPGLDR